MLWPHRDRARVSAAPSFARTSHAVCSSQLVPLLFTLPAIARAPPAPNRRPPPTRRPGHLQHRAARRGAVPRRRREARGRPSRIRAPDVRAGHRPLSLDRRRRQRAASARRALSRRTLRSAAVDEREYARPALAVAPPATTGSITAPALSDVPLVPAAQPARSRAWDQELRRNASIQSKLRIEAGDRVFFSPGSAELGSRARTALAAQAQWLMRWHEFEAAIEGHADEPGTEQENIVTLGAARRGRARAPHRRGRRAEPPRRCAAGALDTRRHLRRYRLPRTEPPRRDARLCHRHARPPRPCRSAAPREPPRLQQPATFAAGAGQWKSPAVPERVGVTR